MLEFALYLGESIHRVRGQVYTGEAQRICVLDHIDEGDNSRPALRGIKPVALPRVCAEVGVAAPPDVNAVQSVVEDRNPDEENLHRENEREAVQKRDLSAIGLGSVKGLEVRNEVLEQKCADGHDAGERMQASQQKRIALARSQGSD